MATPTVVAVYGVPAGQSKVQRIGSGMLPIPEIVVVHAPLDAELGSERPPRVLRVALASLRDGEQLVELREVDRVLESVRLDRGVMWALELGEPARSPSIFGPGGPRPPADHPFRAEELAALLDRYQPRRPDIPGHPPFQPPMPPSPAKPKPPHPHGHPAVLWCVFFPHLCQHSA